MSTSSYTHRIDSELRSQSEAIYSALGLSLGTAINVFLKKSVAVGGFPFDVRLDVPGRETVVAMLEAPMQGVLSALDSGANTIHGVLETLSKRAE